MKKILFGSLLGVFTLAGVVILPNYADADWANPDADANLVGNGDQKLTGSAFLDTIKNAINWILGILATVALVICLYGGFKMVTAAGDEKKYGEGLNVLKYAAIGLAVIGLSWMIVSVIFWFISTLGGKNQTQSSGNQTVNNNTDGSSLRSNSNSDDGNIEPKVVGPEKKAEGKL